VLYSRCAREADGNLTQKSLLFGETDNRRRQTHWGVCGLIGAVMATTLPAFLLSQMREKLHVMPGSMLPNQAGRRATLVRLAPDRRQGVLNQTALKPDGCPELVSQLEELGAVSGSPRLFARWFNVGHSAYKALTQVQGS